MIFLSRTLLRSLACAVLAVSAAGCSGKKTEIVATEPQPQLGLQAWTYNKLTYAETLQKAHALGIRNMQVYFKQELGGGLEGRMGPDMDAATCAKVLALAKAADVTLVSCGVVYATNETDWKQVFATAKALGLKDVTVEPPVEDIPMIAKLAGETGVTLSIHNHPGPKSPYSDTAYELNALKGQPAFVGLCVDTGHYTRTGINPVTALKQLAGHVNYVHFKDLSEMRPQGRDLPWGTGIGDAAGLIAELRRQKFTGIAFVEYEHASPTMDDEIAKSIEFFKRAVAAPLADLEDGKVLPPGYSADPRASWADNRGAKSAKWPTAVPLFDAELSNAEFAVGSWTWSNGVLVALGGGDIWTKDTYGDFSVMLEFRCETNSNSGVFLRCTDPVNWLQNSIEVQILQGDETNKTHVVGAVFDCLAPKKQVAINPGEWVRYVVTARGSNIHVEINGDTVLDMDLNQWTEAHKNPDGSPNKFDKAYKYMPRVGRIGLQYHDIPIEFRNLWVERY